MEWKQWSDKLKEALGLESSPVAITYTNTLPEVQLFVARSPLPKGRGGIATTLFTR